MENLALDQIQFTNEEEKDFLKYCALGYTEHQAMSLAGLNPADLPHMDAQLSLPRPRWRDEYLTERLRPLAAVKERTARIMLDANSPDAPMPLDDALRILERRSPEWSPKQTLTVDTPDNHLTPEEKVLIETLFPPAQLPKP